MWILLAFLSACMLGFYDVFKKKSLNDNAVIPVLLLNTLISSLLFLPFIILSTVGMIDNGTLFHVDSYVWESHRFIMLKSIIVLSSWIFGYFGIKNLPITIVGPINATRPVMVLMGALLIFSEQLNLWQWAGVMIAMLGLYLLSHSGKKEGINFSHNKWIIFVVLSNLLGAISGLYDKYLMASTENGGIGLDKLTVQAWFNIYYCCPLKVFAWKKIRLNPSLGFQPFLLPLFLRQNINNMNKGTHFIGQPMYGQLLNLLDKAKILRFSRENGGERYVKHFDVWQHLVIMLYAVIKRFDSLREITDSMFPEARKLAHMGISLMPRRSTLSDANARRKECIFESVYRDLYATYREELSSDSRRRQVPSWLKRLQIIDSTTITLFSNLIFKGVGRHPKTGKKKGGIKVHANIHANEGVPSDIRFTSAATNDSFMLRPTNYASGDIVALDRAYIDYAKFEELTQRDVTYVTKMKKKLVYQTESDIIHMNPEGVMEYRVRHVVFHKNVKEGEDISHHARIITYVDIKKGKARLVSLLTNDMEMKAEDIVDIYRKRWDIELLFKQLKQNFPLRYFYGESANAIKIQIWVTLIANLLLMVMQRRIRRSWSFSNLATMFRIMLMYYINCYSFFEQPEKDWLKILETNNQPPDGPSLFD